MTTFMLILKSAFRNRLRATLTAGGAALAIVAFLFLRTFVAAWSAGVEGSASDRMIVRNKTAIIFALPLAYVSKVGGLVGAEGAVTYQSWFGAVYPKDEKGFFANFAADDDVFKLYPEMQIPPAELKAYLEDRQGAVVGEQLAQKYGWKVGDRITLRGTIYPGDYPYTVRAIYHSSASAVNNSTFYFHWKYFNESKPPEQRDEVGFLIVKADPARSTLLGKAIDDQFEHAQPQTHTQSEKSFQLEFLSMASSIIKAIQVISAVVLLILMLILANTLAMAGRERTTEYAAMRAIGFPPRFIVLLVLGEGFVIALLGAVVGVAMATPIIQFFGQLFDKQFGGPLGAFELPGDAVAVAAGVTLLLGMLAAALPAYRAGRLNIVDALRSVG